MTRFRYHILWKTKTIAPATRVDDGSKVVFGQDHSFEQVSSQRVPDPGSVIQVTSRIYPEDGIYLIESDLLDQVSYADSRPSAPEPRQLPPPEESLLDLSLEMK